MNILLLTNHASKRMNERCHIKNKYQKGNFSNALKYGKNIEDFEDPLRKYLEKR